MKQTILVVLLAGFFLVFALGCRRHGPIVDFKDAKVPVAVGESLTLDEVAKGIVSAGTKLGWRMKKESPGHIFGKLWHKGHMLAVDIPYTTTAYSILYKESANLNYNPGSKTAHSNLSGWMRNLHIAIQGEFRRAANKKGGA